MCGAVAEQGATPVSTHIGLPPLRCDFDGWYLLSARVWKNLMPRYSYTDDFCLSFAVALKSALGSGAVVYAIAEPRWGIIPPRARHAVVRYGDSYYDVTGEHRSDDLLDAWRAMLHAPNLQLLKYDGGVAELATCRVAEEEAVPVAGEMAQTILSRAGKI